MVHRSEPDVDEGESSDTFLRAVAAAPPVVPRRLLPAQTVVGGAFRIEAMIGAGAMGVVYAATDLALGRRVALKLHAGTVDEVRMARMWREAKAMARLAHPNVVTVHEVGVHEGGVYIAMELVESGTLREWMTEPRSQREVVDAFVQAARGLAAAHHVGVVHRDFKPSNVLVGADGRVRVADFGLARTTDDALESGGLSSTGVDGTPTPEPRATETGAAIGTPAYMAPEQVDGRGVDHRSDQFAFCISLHEALYGVRPFEGESIAEVRAAAARGRVRPPTGRRVPAWLRAVVLRGLQARREDRFPDMNALLDALQRDPTRRRRAALAIAGVIVVGFATWGGLALDRHRRHAACDAGADAIDDTWNEAQRAELHDAVVATGVAFAESTFEHIQPLIDAHALAWREHYTTACIATQVEQARSPELWAASQECLEDRRGELASLLEVLTDDPDAATVRQATAAVAGLGDVAACSDDAWLARHGLRERTDASREPMWHAGALRAAGRFEEATESAQQLLDELDDSDVELRAAVLVLLGELAQDRSRPPEEAVQHLGEAYDLALSVGDDDLAIDAATKLVDVVGCEQSRDDEAQVWARTARALLARIDALDGLAAATLHNHAGKNAYCHGRYEEAANEHVEALAIRERILGSEHPGNAASHRNLSRAYMALARPEDAESAALRGIAIAEQTLGRDHPDVAQARNNLGGLYMDQLKFPEAEREFTSAKTVWEAALGREHADVAAVYNNLANLYAMVHRFDDAASELERAIAIWEKTLGPEHPHVATGHDNLGYVLQRQRRFDDAERHHLAGLALREKVLGAEHPDVGVSLHNLGWVYAQTGRWDQAEAAYVRALAITIQALGADHPDAGMKLAFLAEARTQLGKHAEAMADAERSIALLEPAKNRPIAVAVARFALARSQWEMRTDREGARALAERAKEMFAAAHEDARVADVDRWLAIAK